MCVVQGCDVSMRTPGCGTINLVGEYIMCVLFKGEMLACELQAVELQISLVST